jgi:hypothetical protein
MHLAAVATDEMSKMGFWVQRKKSELKVKRNLIDTNFASRRGKAGIEHKISEFGRKRDSSTSRMPAAENLSDPT